MKLNYSKILATSPRYFRLQPSRGISSTQTESSIDRKGGYKQAGIIRGVSVITRGEALGHGVWVDATMLEQVALGISFEEHGVKSRFTHADMSSDGLGKHVGRIMDAEVVGDQVLADQHFQQSARFTPNGDLATYLMELAEDDPQSYGLSIVYEPDVEAEREFFIEHGGEIIEDPDFGEIWDNENFKSPDPLNVDNLPHARVAALLACDSVGDPAANSGGLFAREQEIVKQADALASYALGLSSKRPETVQLGLDADRVRGFVQRFLSNSRLEIIQSDEAGLMAEADTTLHEDEVQIETSETSEVTEVATETETVADETNEVVTEQVTETVAETEPEPVAASDRSEAQRFRTAFGDRGLAYFADGLSFDEARDRQIEELQAQVASLTKKLAARGFDGELEPVGFDAIDDEQAKGLGMAGKIRIRSR